MSYAIINKSNGRCLCRGVYCQSRIKIPKNELSIKITLTYAAQNVSFFFCVKCIKNEFREFENKIKKANLYNEILLEDIIK